MSSIYPSKARINSSAKKLKADHIRLKKPSSAVGFHLMALLFAQELGNETRKLTKLDNKMAPKVEHVEAASKTVLEKFNFQKSLKKISLPNATMSFKALESDEETVKFDANEDDTSDSSDSD